MTGGVREISLTRGFIALVDEADFGWLNQWKWCAGAGGKYAVRAGGIYMHRFILNAASGQIVDHANGNRLDNRRANLRFATVSQNGANGRPKGEVPYRGVYWDGRRQRFIARIRRDGRSRWLGQFESAEGAASAYDRAALSTFGAFARLNLPEAI
jgi:hypothetical protein